MRTTLDIDEDVLAAAKELARAEGKTMGEVISDLARKGLTSPGGAGFAEGQVAFRTDASDWPTFPSRGGPPVTTELIKQIQFETELEDGIAWDHERDAPRVFEDVPQTTSPRKRPRG